LILNIIRINVGMKKVKITVIKCGLNQELIDKYVQVNIDPCSYNIEGKWLAETIWSL